MTYIIVSIASGPALLCGRCGRISHNPHDVAERYCGGCKTSHYEQPTDALERMRVRIVAAFVVSYPQIYAALRGRVVDRHQRVPELTSWLHERGCLLESLFAQAAIITAEWLIEQQEVTAQ
jgi:hypothetical protein